MKAVGIYRSIAEELYWRVMNVGYAENHYGTPAFFDFVQSILKDAFAKHNVAVSYEAIAFLAQNFPRVDDAPEVEGPDDDRALERDVGSITALLAHVLPDLKASVME